MWKNYYNYGCLLLLAIISAQPVIASTSVPASASNPLILGVFPRFNYTDTVSMYRPISQYLTQVLGQEVKLETATNFSAFLTSVANKRFDIVHYNQYHYLLSHKEQGYKAILKNEEANKSEISSVIIVRIDSDITSLDDLRGKKIVFGGGPSAMMSYIIPIYMFKQAGLKDHEYYKEFAPTPPNALMAVYYGQADAAGIGKVLLDKKKIRDVIDVNELKIVAESVSVAHLVWAVKNDISTDLKAKIQELLRNLNNTQHGRMILENAALTGLKVTYDDEYNILRKIVKQAPDQKL